MGTERKKIENNNSRMVAFSKRQRRMFKQAGELSRFTQCRVAALAFSPSMKPYLFGDFSLLEQAAAAAGVHTKTSSSFQETNLSPGGTSVHDNYKNDHQVDKQLLSLPSYEQAIDVAPLQSVPCSDCEFFTEEDGDEPEEEDDGDEPEEEDGEDAPEEEDGEDAPEEEDGEDEPEEVDGDDEPEEEDLNTLMLLKQRLLSLRERVMQNFKNNHTHGSADDHQ